MEKQDAKLQIAERGVDPVYADELTDEESLLNFFQGVNEYEVYVLIDGINYLKSQYGYKKIAEILLRLDPRFPYEDKKFSQEELTKWIEEVEKYTYRMQNGE